MKRAGVVGAGLALGIEGARRFLSEEEGVGEEDMVDRATDGTPLGNVGEIKADSGFNSVSSSDPDSNEKITHVSSDAGSSKDGEDSTQADETEFEKLSREVLKNAEAYLQGVGKDGVDAKFQTRSTPREPYPHELGIFYKGRLVAAITAFDGNRDEVFFALSSHYRENNDGETQGTVKLTHLKDIIQRTIDEHREE